MINKYLKSLLSENKRVIIPDFGGFVVKRSATGDIISFNSFLKFNDDLLLNAIVESEGLDTAHALKKIKEMVNVINTSLDEEGKYEIEEVGFLIKDKKGNIRFVDQINDVAVAILPLGDEEAVPKDIVEEQEDVEKTEKSVSDSDKDELVENDSVNKATDLEDNEEITEEVSEKMRKGALWIVLVVVLIAAGAWAVSKHIMNRQSSDSVTKTEVINGQDSTANLTDQLEEKHQQLIEKKANDKMKKTVPEEKTGVVKQIIAFIKGLFAKKERDEEVVAEIKAENLEVEVPVMQAYQVDTINGILVVADRDISPAGEERYNVIIGAFSESDNATKLNKSLVEGDYASEIFDRYNGFKAVSIGSYPSLDIALKVCDENLSRIPDIWILVR